ncbi:MAG: hypothetical protein WAK93_13290 [Solirubrobacteraceae bacterium]
MAAISLVVVGLAVIAVIALSGGDSLPTPPPASTAQPIAGNVFGYDSSREAQFVSRATAGNAHALFVKSPGGVLATASRVAAYRPLIDRVTAGTGIDPNLLEGLVFVESAGRPDAIAGTDVADAVGLTQILAETGQSLLGMHIDLQQSRKLTRQIDELAPTAQHAVYGFLLARRQAADPRFSPAAELAATVRYLEIAERQFGREDLAFESYHMGIGNLHQVLDDYDGGASVPYAQLYFDVAPTRHASAYRLLQSFGDDSSLYYWRILGAVSIMHLWRTDRTALRRLVSLQTADDAGAAALGPPQTVSSYADASALAAAYQRKTLVPLPANAAQLGLAVNPQMGAGAAKGAPASLYRGLRPPALHMLIEIGSGVRSLSRVAAPLHVYSTVGDTRYLEAQNALYPPATSGYSFAITRRYAGRGAQATAFQELLDRLQSLDLIAWAREPSTIEITAAPNATSWQP